MRYEQDLLEMYLHCILNGYSPFVYDNALYLAKHLSSKDIFESNCHISLKKEEYKSAGLATEYDILKQYKERGVWDVENDQKIIDLERKIKEIRAIIPKILMPSQVKQREDEIALLNVELFEIKRNKESLVFSSLEHELLREKRDYLSYMGIRGGTNIRLWQTYEEYLNNEASFIEGISLKYYQTIREINDSVIRAVARETDARYRLKICPIPEAKDISTILCELKQWCDFYNSILELSDKPENDIIFDDDKLDKWLIGRRFKNESEKSVNSGDGNGGFAGIVGQKEDMEVMGGVSSNAVKVLAKRK